MDFLTEMVADLRDLGLVVGTCIAAIVLGSLAVLYMATVLVLS